MLLVFEILDLARLINGASPNSAGRKSVLIVFKEGKYKHAALTPPPTPDRRRRPAGWCECSWHGRSRCY